MKKRSKGLHALFYLLSLLPAYRNDLGGPHSFNTCQYVFSEHHETSAHQRWNVKVTLLLLCFAWLSCVEESGMQGFMSLNVPSVIYNYNYHYR